jgi:hypothetical protein
MTKNVIITVFVVAALSILMLSTYTFSGQEYHEFVLGTHVVDGNKITFTFPMPPPSKTFYLFSNQWKLNTPCKRARLVVNLYNKTKDLIGAGESMWANMKNDSTPFGHMTFGSAVIKGVTPDNINDIAYFSVYLQTSPGKNLTVLNDSRPEVRFAREVIAAVMQGKKAYLTLFAGQTLSLGQKKAAETEYEMLRNAIRENPHIASVLPMKPSDAVGIRYSCPVPFVMTFGPRYEHNETAPDGGKTSLSITLSLPIGKVNGKWRLLLPE